MRLGRLTIMGSRVVSPAMVSDINQPRPELSRPRWPATSYRDIQMRIGQAMRHQYELPEELPDQLFTLLMQATGLQENN